MRLTGNYQMVNDSIPFFRRNQIDAIFNYVPLKNNPVEKANQPVFLLNLR